MCWGRFIDRAKPLLSLLDQSLFLCISQVPIRLNLLFHNWRAWVVELIILRRPSIVLQILVPWATRHDEMIAKFVVWPTSVFIFVIVTLLVLIVFIVVFLAKWS